MMSRLKPEGKTQPCRIWQRKVIGRENSKDSVPSSGEELGRGRMKNSGAGVLSRGAEGGTKVRE